MRRRATDHRLGVTLIEVVIVLAMLGVLLSIGAASFRPSESRLYANDVRALIQQARFEAVRRNVPVAVVWDAADDAFLTVLGNDADRCDASTVLNRATASTYRQVEVDIEFDDGLVWLPSGTARSCNLGAFSDVIAVISDRFGSRTVTVSLTGRVTIQ